MSLKQHNIPKSKVIRNLVSKRLEGLRTWNYDGSSTEQADGHNSAALLAKKPGIYLGNKLDFSRESHFKMGWL